MNEQSVMKIFEFLGNFYWPLLPQHLWGSYRNSLRQGHNPFTAAFRCILGMDDYVFFMPLYGGMSGYEVSWLLDSHGIQMFNWSYYHGQQFFYVSKDDAANAHAILVDAGATLL